MTYIPPSGRLNVTITGNTAGVGSLVSAGTLSLAGGNNITLSQNGNAVTISGANTPSGSINISAGGASSSLAAVTFANSNGVSFGLNGGTLTASHNAITSPNINLYVNGNSTQLSSTANVDIRSLSFQGAGAASVGVSQGRVLVSVAPGGGGGGGIALANSETTYTSGTAHMAVAGGAMTIASTTGQSLNFSVPNVSSLVGVNGITVATNGNTISISGGGGGGGGAPTVSRWEYPTNVFTAIGAPVNNSVSLQHVYVPFNVTGQSMRAGAAFTISNFTSATTATMNMSLQFGIYTLSGSTLSLVSSGSALNSFSWSGSAQSSQFNSLRQITAPININMTPGEYWVGALMSTATTYAGATISMYGNDRIVGSGVLGNLGSAMTASPRDVLLGQGLFASAALPSTIAVSAVVNSGTQAMRAGIYHAIYNATY